MLKIDKKVIYILLGLITLLGIELRLALINIPYWYDEAHSILVATQSFPIGINDFLWTKDLQHTPFFFYIMHVWIKLFGISEVALRSFPTIFGVLTIPLTYIVGKKLSSEKVGLIGALLVSVNVLLNYYSTEVRMYSIIIFLALLSINFLLDFDKNGNKKSLLNLFITNALIPYFLIGAITFNIAEFLAYGTYLFIKEKNNVEKIKLFIRAKLFGVLILVPYLMLCFYYYLTRKSFIMSHISNFEFVNLIGLLQNYFAANIGTIFWSTYNPYTIDFQFFVFAIIPIIFFINALITAFKTRESKILLIFAIVILSAIPIIISAMAQIIVLAPRYLIFISPLLMILSAIGFARFKKVNLIIFLIFYSLISCYTLYENKAVVNMKTAAIYSNSRYITSRGLNENDIIFKPFASSVGLVYMDKHAPRMPYFEVLHEFRIPNNEKVYDNNQIFELQKGNVDEVIFDFVQNRKHISNTYYNYIKNEYTNKVQSGRYILMIIYGPDISCDVPTNVYRQQYNSVESIHNNRINAVISKLFDDTQQIFAEDCDLVEKVIIDQNLYILFRKK